jgi:hypothetical protein
VITALIIFLWSLYYFGGIMLLIFFVNLEVEGRTSFICCGLIIAVLLSALVTPAIYYFNFGYYK